MRTSNGHFEAIDDPHGGTDEGQGTLPEDINDNGTVVGQYVDSHNVNHGFVYSHGVFTIINAPHAGTGANQGTILATQNDNGVILGEYIDSNNLSHGFVDDAGIFTTLNALGRAPVQGRVQRLPRLRIRAPSWARRMGTVR